MNEWNLSQRVMTFGNSEGVRRCIRSAIAIAGIGPEDIDLISGHLTSTVGDTFEANNWRCALQVPVERFPLLNAPKSLFGHTLGAGGAIECVAAILQLQRGFVHPSLNPKICIPNWHGAGAASCRSAWKGGFASSRRLPSGSAM